MQLVPFGFIFKSTSDCDFVTINKILYKKFTVKVKNCSQIK